MSDFSQNEVFDINELLEIWGGMTACPITGLATIEKQHIEKAIEICVAEMERQTSPEIQLAIANGKIEGMEFALNALTRQK